MRPIKLALTPAALDLDGFANDATGAGPFAVTASPDDDMAHLVSFDTAANLSTITATITGTDADGRSITEAVVLPNATTNYSTKHFATVSSVSVSATLGANTLDIGWGAVSVSHTIMLDHQQDRFNVGLAVDVSGTINYGLQVCYEDILNIAAVSALSWFAHDSISGETTDQTGTQSWPATAVRLIVNSVTATATAKVLVVQGY